MYADDADNLRQFHQRFILSIATKEKKKKTTAPTIGFHMIILCVVKLNLDMYKNKKILK